MSEPRKAQVGVTIKGASVLDSVRAIRRRSGDEAFDKLVDGLDDEAKAMFRGEIVASSWYPLDPFVRFLEADIRETAGGNEVALVERTEQLIEKQLRGIYRIFVRLGSPEFVLKRISVVHMTYYNGVLVETTSLTPGRAVLRYTGFERRHRIVGYAIIGFFKKALEISGAKDVKASWTIPIGDPKGYAELAVTWH